jgi:hypothetical protein
MLSTQLCTQPLLYTVFLNCKQSVNHLKLNLLFSIQSEKEHIPNIQLQDGTVFPE